jgi:hypothetical protein
LYKILVCVKCYLILAKHRGVLQNRFLSVHLRSFHILQVKRDVLNWPHYLSVKQVIQSTEPAIQGSKCFFCSLFLQMSPAQLVPGRQQQLFVTFFFYRHFLAISGCFSCNSVQVTFYLLRRCFKWFRRSYYSNIRKTCFFIFKYFLAVVIT